MGATSTTSVHLANQDYDVCVRRLADRCAICWSPTGIAGAAIVRGNFGLSNGATAIATTPLAGVGPYCAAIAMTDSNDYVIIPNGVVGTAATAAAIGNTPAVTQGADKFCGRFFNPA